MGNPKPNQSGIEAYRFTRLPEGTRNTSPQRVALPLELAARWETMGKEERSKIALVGFQTLEGQEGK